jgi:hypothetical protein
VKTGSSLTFLKPGQSIGQPVRVDRWTLDFDLEQHSFELRIFCGNYGYAETVPINCVYGVLEMFKFAGAEHCDIMLDARGGRRKLTLGTASVAP